MTLDQGCLSSVPLFFKIKPRELVDLVLKEEQMKKISALTELFLIYMNLNKISFRPVWAPSVCRAQQTCKAFVCNKQIETGNLSAVKLCQGQQ